MKNKIIKRLHLCFSVFFKLLHVFTQMIYGLWKVSKLPSPIVSIFGGAQLAAETNYFEQAHELAARLANSNVSVLTGGGPGVMEAASCGAIMIKNKGKTMGIGVKNLGEGKNPCVQEYFELNYFFARKWLLTRYSVGFVVFPGGFGTLDELSEVLTLIKNEKMGRVPIILIGREYWHYFMMWLEQEALEHKLIKMKDLELFTITDDLDQAFYIIRDECKRMEKGGVYDQMD
ncbi:MAG: TIGR00730 family Rossman fold protein [bacterium]|nr:TIGR00730 family Rossman fold protein [bacterium]